MKTISELMNLKGRKALITGATGLLGSVIAKTLAELGSDLILVDHPNSNFLPLTESLSNHWNIKVSNYSIDLESHDERLKLLDQVKSEHHQLNILINNAAFVGKTNLKGWTTNFENQSVDTFRRAIEVNLAAPFHLSQGFSPFLRQSKGASIINIGSIYGKYAPDWNLYKGTNMGNPAAYGSSKAGLIQLTRWLSTTLGPNIRVNAISPGGVYVNQPEEFVKRYESRTPLGRMAKDQDICGGIAYLAGDLSSYVTGQEIMIDGGWGIW